jgi:hypothetical protein
VDYGWQNLDTKITAFVFGGPPSTAFIKVANTKGTKNRFRSKRICALNTDTVAKIKFFLSEF